MKTQNKLPSARVLQLFEQLSFEEKDGLLFITPDYHLGCYSKANVLQMILQFIRDNKTSCSEYAYFKKIYQVLGVMVFLEANNSSDIDFSEIAQEMFQNEMVFDKVKALNDSLVSVIRPDHVIEELRTVVCSDNIQKIAEFAAKNMCKN